MRLVYLVANQAWVFVFGTALIPMDDVMFHDTRADAVRRAGQHRLNVSRAGVVSAA